MAVSKAKKAEILQELIEKFGRTKTVVFSDYRGLDVASMSKLRRELRAQGAETKVAKKTLIRLAAQENDIKELGDDIMEGPVAVTFSYNDELAGLKALFKFSKENDKLKLLGGIIDGKALGKDDIIQLAKLPGREELLAKFLGSLNAPVSGFVGILGNLLGGFVRVLGAYKDTLPATPAAPATSAPATKPEEAAAAPTEPSAETSNPPVADAPAGETAEKTEGGES